MAKIILNEDQLKYILNEISAEAIALESENVNTNPTDKQKEAGNYRKGHISVDGFKITIEQPVGSFRKWKDEATGKEGQNEFFNVYGYFGRTDKKGKDGDAVDVYLSNDIDKLNHIEKVYVIDQNHADGSFDESKVMFGFDNKEEAKQAYLRHYSEGWENRIRAITGVSRKLFKAWLYRGRKQQIPFSEYVKVQKHKLEEQKTNKKMEL